MNFHTVYALLDENKIVQDLILNDNEESASTIASSAYIDGIAINVSNLDVRRGDFLKLNKFYHPVIEGSMDKGIEVKNSITLEEQIANLESVIRLKNKQIQYLEDFLNIKNLNNIWLYDFKDVYYPGSDSIEFSNHVLKILSSNKSKDTILDIFAGTGYIGLFLSRNLGLKCALSDISDKAICSCILNSNLNNIDADVIKSDVLDNIYSKFDVITAFSPFLTDEEYDTYKQTHSLGDNDIKSAFVYGSKKFEVFDIIVEQSTRNLNPNGFLFLNAPNHNAVEHINKLMLDNKFKNISFIKLESTQNSYLIYGQYNNE